MFHEFLQLHRRRRDSTRAVDPASCASNDVEGARTPTLGVTPRYRERAFGASSWFGGLGQSVCASTDLPFCWTVGAADWFSPPASGRMALRSTGCLSGASVPSDPGALVEGEAAGGHGFGTCDHAGLAIKVIRIATVGSFAMAVPFPQH
jgi:hypothetical protein